MLRQAVTVAVIMAAANNCVLLPSLFIYREEPYFIMKRKVFSHMDWSRLIAKLFNI